MVEQARQFAASNKEPAEARWASTVVLVRPAEGAGYEVFAIRRVTTMAFAAGMYAFPGGVVDPRDFTVASLGDKATVAVASLGDKSTAAVELDWAGPPPSAWAARLGLDEASAKAVLCAAVREVFEESGVLLAGPDPSTVVGDVSGDDWEAARQDLEGRRLGFAALLADRQLTLRSDLLLPWSRWITPEFEPRRFDTYFFIALLPEGQRTRDVSGEADHTLWIRPADALARALAGELTMLPPTLVTLAEVAAAGDLAGVARAAADRDAASPITPRLDMPPNGKPRFVLG
jgi:8-oxo-dGTP pyrophosphatase MutT (NUDIX family)